MSETSDIRPVSRARKWVSVLSVIASAALLAAVFANFIRIYAGINRGGFGVVDYIVTVALAVTGVFAVYYISTGCKKSESAKYYKLFMNLFALALLVTLAGHKELNTAALLFTTIAFGALTVLSIAENPGKKKSLALASVVIACCAAIAVSDVLTGQFAARAVSTVTELLLSLAGLLMVFAKYLDKKERGSK